MAITGNSDNIYEANLNMNATGYSHAVGGAQGNIVHGDWEYYNKYAKGSPKTGYTTDYNEGTVAGKYVLKGKAGITPQFYRAFSDAFDDYKTVIENDLSELQTNPNIHQAFSGTEIEKAVKDLIIAVEQEAHDYLFKLEQAEKTVINSVEKAFKKQQENMGSSMGNDTKILSNGNSTADEISAFRKQDVEWGGTPDGAQRASGGVTPGGVDRVTSKTTYTTM